MKITEKHLREFFPRDMRFTHYVAKRYNLKFYDDDAAERANASAQEAVLKMYNQGREFESNEHLYGIVMTSFRFAILRSFKKKSNENLRISTESELIFGEPDDEYNLYLTTAKVDPEEYDNSASAMIDIMRHHLTREEFSVFKMRYEYNFSTKEISSRVGKSEAAVETIKKRIQKKFKEIKDKIELNGKENNKRRSSVVTRTNREANIRLQREARNKRIEQIKKERVRGAEALSWLDINPQV